MDRCNQLAFGRTLPSLFRGMILGILGSAASSDTIRCAMPAATNRHYIAPEVELVTNDSGGVVVRDAVIRSSGRDMVFGSIASESATKLVIRWDVMGVDRDPGEKQYRAAHLVVRLSLQKDSGAASMHVLDAQTAGYEYRATGSCTTKE